jgi:hypothetical protein
MGRNLPIAAGPEGVVIYAIPGKDRHESENFLKRFCLEGRIIHAQIASNPLRLTKNEVDDREFAWSPVP